MFDDAQAEFVDTGNCSLAVQVQPDVASKGVQVWMKEITPSKPKMVSTAVQCNILKTPRLLTTHLADSDYDPKEDDPDEFLITMATGGNAVALIGHQTTLNNASGSETARKSINLFSHCEVEMKTEYSAASSNDLLKAQADILVQRWREEYDVIMVETRAYQHVKEMLDESHSVLISGAPGDGKTTLAVRLALSLVSEGYLPVVVYSPADVQRCCNPYEKMAFFLDDVFGKSYLVSQYLEDWVQRGHMVSQLMSKNIKFIFTNRNEILHDCLTKLREIPAFNNLVDLKHFSISLTSSEKKAIFNSLIAKYQGSHDYPLDVIDTFCNEPHIIGFPATCRLIAICGHMSDPREIMNAPFTFLVKEMSRLSEMDETRLRYAMLVLVMLYDGRLSQRLLSDTSISAADRLKVQDVIACLGVDDIGIPFCKLAKAALASKSYIICKDGYWMFIDQVTKNAVSVVFGKNHLRQFIEYTDRGHLYSLLNVDDNAFSNVTITPFVTISPDDYRVIFCKMTNDVLHGHHALVLKTNCLQDVHFRENWIMYLLENHRLYDFTQAVDEYDRTPMYYMAVYGRKDMLDCCLKYRNDIFLTAPDKLFSIADYQLNKGRCHAIVGAFDGGHNELAHSLTNSWYLYSGSDLGYWLEKVNTNKRKTDGLLLLTWSNGQ